VGALYIKKGVKINPRTFGGSQENKIRPGTEAMPAIAGFAAAAKALPDPVKELEHVSTLRDYMVSKLEEVGDDFGFGRVGRKAVGISPERSEHCEAMSLEGCGKNYRANGTLIMLPSPGFVPNTLKLPVKKFDFSGVEVKNAPWHTIWDDKTGVAWEARMVDGALYYIAITNAPTLKE
jgi:hypothetical protein